MNKNPTRRLLDDVLQEEQSFHDQVIDEMLRQARHRRHRRQVIRGAAALLLLALMIMPMLNRKSDRLRLSAVANNVPAAQHLMIVETRVGSLAVFSSSRGAVTMVETPPTTVEQLSDERLLALVAPRPAALVWRNPSEAELVFADYQSAGQSEPATPSGAEEEHPAVN